MLKLEPPAGYYNKDASLVTRMQREPLKMERQEFLNFRENTPRIPKQHFDEVSPSQVDSVVSGIMHTHIDDYQLKNCQHCRNPNTVDSPEGKARMLHSLLVLHRQQEVEMENNHQRELDRASLSGDSDGPRTTSPMSIGSISRGSSFSRNRATHSASPALSTSSLSAPKEEIGKSKLYNMLRQSGGNNDYSYPSAQSATTGVGPYINTPPSYYRPSSRSNSFSHPRQQPDMYPSSMSSSLVRHVREKVCYTPPPDEAQQDYSESNFRKRSYSATVPRSTRLHEERPIDLSCKRPKTLLELPSDTPRECLSQPSSPPSTSVKSDDNQASILRSILCGRLKKIEDSKSQNSNAICSPHSVVSLAKKNMLPVSARITDWLVKLVEFAGTLPEFSDLSQEDKVTLILGSWSRIILLYMAETNFHFVVTPNGSEGTDSPGSPTAAQEDPTIPTMKRVDNMQAYINKCQSLNLDAEEYECLRIMTLFSSQSGKLKFSLSVYYNLQLLFYVCCMHAN